MQKLLRPRELCELTAISASYASQILSGARPCPQDIALAAFRAFGVRLGLLAEMTEADIAKLASQPAPECHGGDAAASEGDESESVHGATDNAGDASLSTGQIGEMSPNGIGAAGGENPAPVDEAQASGRAPVAAETETPVAAGAYA